MSSFQCSKAVFIMLKLCNGRKINSLKNIAKNVALVIQLCHLSSVETLLFIIIQRHFSSYKVLCGHPFIKSIP